MLDEYICFLHIVNGFVNVFSLVHSRCQLNIDENKDIPYWTKEIWTLGG